jgi:sorbitol-specific phosphotransferase system component IIC
MVVSFIVIVPIIAVLGYLSQSMAGVGKFIPNHRRRGFSSMAGSRHQTVDGVFKMEAQVSRIQGTSEKG